VGFFKAMACSKFPIVGLCSLVLAAEWSSIAALSAAMEKDILLRVLCVLSEAGGNDLLTHLTA
jgi:hypothetical protein